MSNTPPRKIDLPCPFCGHMKSELHTGSELMDVEPWEDWFFFECMRCGAQGPASESSKQAKDRWNSR